MALGFEVASRLVAVFVMSKVVPPSGGGMNIYILIKIYIKVYKQTCIAYN